MRHLHYPKGHGLTYKYRSCNRWEYIHLVTSNYSVVEPLSPVEMTMVLDWKFLPEDQERMYYDPTPEAWEDFVVPERKVVGSIWVR